MGDQGQREDDTNAARHALVEQTEEQMQYSEMPCSSCKGRGTVWLYGGPPDEEERKCKACGGVGRVRFRRKNMKLEDISEIIESNSLKEE